MKIIHCADFHLGAGMRGVLDEDKAMIRRSELLGNFERLAEFAESEGAGAVLIAGDLFDGKSCRLSVKRTVLSIIEKYRDITFYYLRGNHDSGFEFAGEKPDNLRTFGTSWTSYEEANGRIAITGAEFLRRQGQNMNSVQQSVNEVPKLSPDKVNIVLLHGQAAEYGSADNPEIIGLRDYRNRNIDYLALGHVHGYSEGKLDEGSIWCYPGCPEGRGFDECGTCGIVLLDIDEEKRRIEHCFIPFGQRSVFSVETDISECETSYDILSLCRKSLMDAGAEPGDIVRVILTGSMAPDGEADMDYVRNTLSGEYFFATAEKKFRFRINPADFVNDISLKGEFVRTVLADTSLSEKEREGVIRYGLLALRGEL